MKTNKKKVVESKEKQKGTRRPWKPMKVAARGTVAELVQIHKTSGGFDTSTFKSGTHGG